MTSCFLRGKSWTAITIKAEMISLLRSKKTKKRTRINMSWQCRVRACYYDTVKKRKEDSRKAVFFAVSKEVAERERSPADKGPPNGQRHISISHGAESSE